MSYFNKFPQVLYEFGQESSITTNLTAYAEVLDQVRLSSSFYQDYYIKSGERPDHVAFQLYGNPQLHWTFYLMNPKLREQSWPMSSLEVDEKVKKDHPNIVLTFKTPDITTLLSVGQKIKGYTSGAVATILNINLDLGQVTVDSDKHFNQSELIQDRDTLEVFSTLIVSSSVSEHLATHHYTKNGERIDINPYDSIPSDVVKVTLKDFYTDQNDSLKQIRVIKPSDINQVVSAFSNAVGE